MAVKFCGNCGAKLEPTSRFCAECGTPVAQEAPVQQINNAAVQAPMANNYQPINNQQSAYQLAANQNQAQYGTGTNSLFNQLQAKTQGLRRADAPSRAGENPFVAWFKDTYLHTDGRLNRLSYFFGGLFIWICDFVLLMLGILGFYMIFSRSGVANVIGALLCIAVIGISLVFIVASWMLSIRRCHDFGVTGFAMLLYFIPYVDFIWALCLLFIPGTYGPNRYGPDPSAR